MGYTKYDITERGRSSVDIYRGKTVDTNEWVKGKFTVIADKCYIIPQQDCAPIEVQPDTLGLRMNSNAYEDDVIQSRDDGREGIVVYSTSTPSGLIYVKSEGMFRHFYEFGAFEVLGNIHDKPELLDKIGKSYAELNIW